MDKQKCKDMEFRCGPIIGKYVIYRGMTTTLAETNSENFYKKAKDYIRLIKAKGYYFILKEIHNKFLALKRMIYHWLIARKKF